LFSQTLCIMERMNMFGFLFGARRGQQSLMDRKQLCIFLLGLAASLSMSLSAQAQETWTWLGGTADVEAASNWSPSTPGALAGPPGVSAGNQFGRIASFGATGSTVLTQAGPNYWLEQFIFQPGAQAYTYTATDAAAYLSFAPSSTAVDINAIDNRSTSLQIFNFPSTGTGLGYDGYIKTTAGGGDVVVNGPVAVSDGSNTAARFSGATGSGNVYFNVDTSVHPNGNVSGGAWATGGASGAYNCTRNRFFTDGLSGRVYLGDIGTAYRGTFYLNSTGGGAVRLTHNNSLGDPGAYGGGGTSSTAVVIQGGNFETAPTTAYHTTLELANNINVRRAVMHLGPRAGATIGNRPHISNVSGNNTLTVGADWNTHGLNSFTAGFISGNWNIESQAGLLTLAGGDGGGIIYNTAPVNVDLQLMGAGNGQIDAPISKWQSNPTLRIVKKGTGTWTLTNSNMAPLGNPNFDGNVVVEQGTLALSGAGSFADSPSIDIRSGAFLNVTGVGGYTLNSLNLAVKGAGTITGNLTAGFGNTIAPGDSGTGTFNVAGELNLTGGALTYELTNNPAGANDKIAVVGNLNLSGSTTLNVLPLNGNLGSGTYNLMSYTGSLTGDATNLMLTGTPASARQTFALNSSTPNQINLVVTGSVANLTWVGGNNANAWDNGVTLNNWSGHADNHFYDGDKVTFATSGTATPNIVGTVAPGQVDFTNGLGKNYTLSGGTMNVASHLTLSGAGDVTFANDTTTVAGNTTLSGSGTVNISSATSFSTTGSFAVTGSSNVNLTSGAFNVPSVALSGESFAVNRSDDMVGLTALASSFSGTGSFVKKNSNTVEISGNNSGFTGTMVVEAGTLATRSTTALANSVTVQSGATLDLGSTNTTAAVPGGGTAAITISGSGVAGLGALTATTAGPTTFGNNPHIGALTLAGNSTIRIKSPAASPSGADQTPRVVLWVDGPVTGNGNTLTAIVDNSIGGGTEMDFINNGVTNIGNLNLSGGGAFYIGGTTDLGATGMITLGDAVLNGDPTDNTVGRLGIYGNQSASGSLVSVTKPISVTSTGGGIELYRQITGSYTVGSTIAMGGNLNIDLHNGNSNTTNHLVLSGAMSGAGNLDVHLVANATASRLGKIDLNSNSITYAGTTTIGGGGGLGGAAAANDRITLNVNGNHTGGGDYTVHGAATLGGTGSTASNVVVNIGGTINPGAGPGTLAEANSGVGTLTVGGATFSTDLVTPGGLLIEYDGAADILDKLVVTGALDITNAVVDFDNLGTGVLNGSPKVFASYGSLTGAVFANILDLPTDYTIDYNYLGTKQIALVGGPAVVTGDYNSDGKVDAADYVVWRKNPGAFPPDAYQVWRANFSIPPGAGAGAGLDGGAVPEPGTWVLMICVLIGAISSRRRSH
jgi:autotransporter-associated beta strand protein